MDGMNDFNDGKFVPAQPARADAGAVVVKRLRQTGIAVVVALGLVMALSQAGVAIPAVDEMMLIPPVLG